MDVENLIITNLILKDLSGEASDFEKKEIQDWKNKNQDNQNFYGDVVRAWINDEEEDSVKKFDGKLVYDRLFNDWGQSQGENIKEKNKFIPLFLRVAAIFIVVFLSLYFYNRSHNNFEIVNNGPDVICDTLSDGTILWMNTNSKIILDSGFGKKNRNVSVVGEIYFDIFHDKTLPFYVNTDIATILVTGTEFNVSYNPESNLIEVDVESGRVQFYNDEDIYSGKSFKSDLTAGEFAYYSFSSGEMIREQQSDLNYLCWKTGIVSFKSTSLSDVIETLSKVYNVNIKTNYLTPDRFRLSAIFNNKELEDIIRNINSELHRKFDLKEEVLFINKN